MTPRLLDAGEAALVVEFGDRIDPGTNARVLALDAALGRAAPPGLVERVPTYRSILLHYDPLVLPRDDLVRIVGVALAAAAPEAAPPGRLWTLPACYDPGIATDLHHVAESCGLDPGAVAALHSGATYRLCMYGFAPGWAYLDGLPAALALPRRASPRDRIEAGSLIVAGGQAIVAGPAMPSGWHVIGRTPERMFAPDRTPAFLMAPGDRLRFAPVGRDDFAALGRAVAAGQIVARAEAE
jgi:KipI family sensor histidine kinase inhibitor